MDSGPRTAALSDTGTGRAPGRDYSRVADIAIATLDHRSIHEIETFGSVHGTGESLRPCHTHDSPRGCVITVIAEPMRVVIGYPILWSSRIACAQCAEWRRLHSCCAW